MIKVVLTRSEEDLQKDRELFEREGFVVIPLPLIKTEPLEFELLEDDFDFVVFPSAKAVNYFLSRRKLKGNEKVIAVGEATKKAVESYNYSVYQVPENYYAEEIKLLLKGQKGKVLIPRSQEGREDLIKDLESLGFYVKALNVYTTKGVSYQRDEFLTKVSEGDVVVFASPSAVRSFFANLPKPEGAAILKEKKVVCIGKTTNQELLSICGLSGLLPEKPSFESIVKLLKSLAQSLQ
ncbi:MAG: uroporphyrinogen-III synthase [Hydrogenobacter thermophilus]|uniref:uroporphyrinogen-III synthase n=1 Tax=Hydrogenobacter thermophilus TaxID=940 RepID=UPI001C76B19F|nr:uroporphyrinogen-III synthase [Hydrogenobacter thermophilus]QWK19349.1 MAG: uroporphyrinogen-III synthase [Hydrogenobacter thermophilus]